MLSYAFMYLDGEEINESMTRKALVDILISEYE
jgi:hypothetical protein